MKNLIPVTLILIIIFSGCQKQPEFDNFKSGEFTQNYLDVALERLLYEHSGGIGKQFFILPESDDFDNIPQDPLNPLTVEKVELGKLLFHETGLAVHTNFQNSVSTISCATCHHHRAGFQAGLIQGIGDGGIGFGITGEQRKRNPDCPEDSTDFQPIRSPTIMNSAYQKVMLWNGQFGATGPNVGTESLWTPGTPLENNFLGYEGVEIQAIAGLTVHRMGIPMDLFNATEYKEMFDEAFPDFPEDERYTPVTAGLAIAAYERTVLSNESAFQKYLRGMNSALTDEQKEGAILFFGKANCVACHTGPALNSMEFYAYGMNDLEGDEIMGGRPDLKTRKGRGGFTGIPSEEFTFKVPQLYSLRQARFLGHGSSFSNIEDVVRYKNKGVKENKYVPNSQLADEFVPLGLNEREIQKLTAFIEWGLLDDQLERYAPPAIPSGNCFPNNDEQSRVDLGCELPL